MHIYIYVYVCIYAKTILKSHEYEGEQRKVFGRIRR